MKNISIGIIKEGKIPVDHRVALTPDHCKNLLQEYSNLQILVEPSDIRCFGDDEYEAAGATLTNDVSECEVIFGVKEVPLDKLIPQKKYLFFSHTIKKQPYNQNLLAEVVNNKIQLIDYECLRNESGRVVAFGRWAGIVGAYNAFWTYGAKTALFQIKRANACFDMKEMWAEFEKIKLPALKIVITGGGRVALGAMEVLDGLNIKKVSKEAFLNDTFNKPVYCQLDVEDYTVDANGAKINKAEFFKDPRGYKSTFLPFTKIADIFIACAYWDPNAPALFTKEEAQQKDFNLQVIADVTCDIEGSVPTTVKPTTIADPVFDFDLSTWKECPPFVNPEFLSVMSVDNLPCELPRDASTSFGDQLVANVMAELIGEEGNIVKGASITNLDGDLNPAYEYLRDYLEG